ncbi:MAG: UDP-N-acetylmuramoyl-tripeptide--D-alanyl-D-alanine ligase [Bacteroidaceae bacterium]|nr:UDP-N-acetylmuramoyl-tripeptide--D-alanyl-D-alanine ligase [Bacteroidaceae bacterium]
MVSIEHIYSHFIQSTGITTDTRQCKEGMMFVALRGENFDGNRYAESALEQGCSYVVIDNAEYAAPSDERYLLVDDSLRTLQQLARHHRRALGLPIVGITGTNGKTTTKELVAAVLARKYRLHYTQGNLNNHIGVPITLLQFTSEHEMAVVEMGASHPGDIKELVEIAEPDYGLITNVGMAHLQGFGSLEGVIRTKGEMYDYLRTTPRRTIFLNINEHNLCTIAEGLEAVTYGQSEETDICGKLIDCAPYLRFQWRKRNGKWHEVTTQLIGSYNISNALCAVAVGTYFGVPEEEVSAALTEYAPTNNRSQLTRTEHNTLIVDAYNANPTSMHAAIDNFELMEASRKMLILGDMKELGEATATAHQEVVNRLGECHFDEIWLVGTAFAATRHTQRTFADAEEVKATLQAYRPEGFHILIKGSNSMKLASLTEWL